MFYLLSTKGENIKIAHIINNMLIRGIFSQVCW